jgi:NADH-quinone oxidoreductase subunit E
MEKTEIERILDSFARNRSQIIAILHEIQDAERYLSEEDLRVVANRLDISLSQIYQIATFYKAFSLKPKGKHICNVCLGTACHVRGAPLVLEELERRLAVKTGDTTQDGEFSLATVNCLGACALGPLVTVDGEYFGNMSTAKVQRVLRKFVPADGAAAASGDDATSDAAGAVEAAADAPEAPNEARAVAPHDPGRAEGSTAPGVDQAEQGGATA